MSIKKAKSKSRRRRVVKLKAWAVLVSSEHHPRFGELLTFGSLAKSHRGALSVFSRKVDADRMNSHGSWSVVPCSIQYERPSR